MKTLAQIIVPPDMPVGGYGGSDVLWEGIIPGIIQLLLFLAFILAIIYLLWGGISWISSGGNKESLAAAKKKITYALLGLVLVLLSFAILYTFGNIFGVNLKNP